MNKEFVVDKENEGKRQDIFVLEMLKDVSRSHIKNMIEKGEVLINGKIKKSGEKLCFNDIVSVNFNPPKEMQIIAENIDIEIVHEDEDVVVVNKPQGLVVHPANGNEQGTLVNALLFHIKDLSGINGVVRPGIVHRLDKDTSGLLMIAKNDKAHVNLASQIQNKTCFRHYLALVKGTVTKDFDTITTYIGRNKKDRKQMAIVNDGQGKLAITNYTVLKRFRNYTLMEFVLKTGRTHQIRVHAKHIGHSVVGDEVYGVKDKTIKTNGQLLHAYKIEFTQPTTKNRVCLQVQLPKHFSDVLDKISKSEL